jgi:AraC family transcriptional regulator of adaptative response / DNA-3-methyladenine glycosylase II
MKLNREICIRALDARDPRFDGVFFVGVASTGIYCRPVCPARAPRRDRCRFFASAAAAERRGFRPCLRCRPELAPGMAHMDVTSRVARAAISRIAGGALNRAGVENLAREFSITGRQLRRVVEQEVGASPIALAQTHRLLLAKQLLTDTPLSMTEVAFASGFQSVRRFDALFQSRYRLTPSRLRRRAVSAAPVDGDSISLTLGYRAPLAWNELLAFLDARATPGVEMVVSGVYARTIALNGHCGWVRVQPAIAQEHGASSTNDGAVEQEIAAAGRVSRTSPRIADRQALRAEISLSLMPVLMPLLAKLRHLFDLDADPRVVDEMLSREGLASHVQLCAGLRVPGAIDGFELALRAVLGQQVSVKGATTLSGRFAARFGTLIATPDSMLAQSMADVTRVAEAPVAELQSLGITGSRAACVSALANAVASGALKLEPGADVGVMLPRLLALPGIGDWTAQYIVMRALRSPDGFPAGDLWLRRAAGDLSVAKLTRLSERWRPWRAYAAMHLWNGIDAGCVMAMPKQ